MRTLILVLSLFFTSCTKEYSIPPAPANEIRLTIKITKYTITVNGSTGACWQMSLKANKPLDKDYFVHYSFDDLPNKITTSHVINANSTENISYTQIFALGNWSNVRLIKVVGADAYKFILNP